MTNVVCILAPRYPFPEIGGDVLRINSIAKYFKSIGKKVILVSFYENNQMVKKSEEGIYDYIYCIKRSKFDSLLYSFLFLISGKSIQLGYYFSFKYNKLLKKVIRDYNPDIYVSHLLRMVPYLKMNHLKDNVIIEMSDALSKTYILSASSKTKSLKSFIYALEKKRVKKLEQEVISFYPKVSLVSKNDIDYLGNASNVKLYPLGVQTTTNNMEANINKICFVGNMRTLQNQEAVLYFTNEIWPILKKEHPDLEFYVVGAEPPSRIKELTEKKDIFVTGYVDSVEEFISDAYFLIAPVNIAAGAQYKVLIGMGQKIPVVLSSLISKAIPELANMENCLIASTTEEYIEACNKLFNDKQLRNTIAENGYKMIKEVYSIFAKLKDYEVLDAMN